MHSLKILKIIEAFCNVQIYISMCISNIIIQPIIDMGFMLQMLLCILIKGDVIQFGSIDTVIVKSFTWANLLITISCTCEHS